ncbi:MAG: hypothetical protein GPJ54_04340 [Candidatus Heimdallarchaeota archaeon]|nr:hypothetical protein [Candidatus Heimdallarchaeota archaeon]
MVEISFEKIKIEIQSLDQSYNENIKILNNMLTEAQEVIKSEIANRDEALSSQKNMKQEISELLSLRSKLELEEKSLSESVASLKTENGTLEAHLTEGNSRKLEIDNKLKEETRIADSLASDISGLEANISDEDAKITHAQNDSMQQTEQLEIEVNHVKQLLAIQNNYSKILKSMLKDHSISLPHFDVCKVLTQQGVNNLDRLVMSSGVDKNTVTETLKELSGRGVIDYNLDSGEFTIIKAFEL